MGCKQDLTGERFGKLTVLERTPETQDRYAVWRCRCDCGGEILVNTKRLKRGTVTNCGCTPKMSARRGPATEDLTGRQFGRLTVLSQAESKRGRTAWLCRCSCGNIHTVVAQDLKSGRVKSCGCLQHTKERGMADITGQRFGRLTALYTTKKRDKKGSIVWHCRCDCGRETDVTQDGLVYGNYRSCGCLRKELQSDLYKQLHLIDGTCVEWLNNRKKRSDNTSGFRGVSMRKNGTYWASIGFKGQRFYIGTYKTFEQAVEHRLEAEKLIHEGFVNAYYAWAEKAEGNPEWEEENPLIFEVKHQDGRFTIITNQGGFT